jgi:hypothetical protein
MANLSIGCCGLNCEKCPVLLATKTNDDGLRAKTAREYTDLYGEYLGGHILNKEDMNCSGCQSDSDIFLGCELCIISKCCQEQKLTSCANCVEYLTCNMLQGFYSIPANQPAKDCLDSIRAQSKKY